MELAITAKEREMEIMENNHRVTLRVYEQKVKQLEYTHKNDVNLILTSGENTSLTSTKEQDIERKRLLEEKKLQIQNEKLRLEKENVEKISSIKLEHEAYLSKLSSQFEEGLRELIFRCDTRKETIETDYELRRRVDVHEVEERKNMHINELINNHKNSFKQMKEYYNKITYENLNLIKSLQGQIRELKSRSENNKTALLQYKVENDRLTDLSAKEAQRMATLQSQLRQRKNDKLALKNALSRQSEVEKKLKISLFEFSKLRAEYSSVEQEHSELCNTFEDNINMVNDQSNEMNRILENRLKALKEKNLQLLQSTNDQESLESRLKQVEHDLDCIHIANDAGLDEDLALLNNNDDDNDEQRPPVPPSHEHSHVNEEVQQTSQFRKQSLPLMDDESTMYSKPNSDMPAPLMVSTVPKSVVAGEEEGEEEAVVRVDEEVEAEPETVDESTLQAEAAQEEEEEVVTASRPVREAEVELSLSHQELDIN